MAMTVEDINMYELYKYNEELREQDEVDRTREYMEMHNMYLDGQLEC